MPPSIRGSLSWFFLKRLEMIFDSSMDSYMSSEGQKLNLYPKRLKGETPPPYGAGCSSIGKAEGLAYWSSPPSFFFYQLAWWQKERAESSTAFMTKLVFCSHSCHFSSKYGFMHTIGKLSSRAFIWAQILPQKSKNRAQKVKKNLFGNEPSSGGSYIRGVVEEEEEKMKAVSFWKSLFSKCDHCENCDFHFTILALNTKFIFWNISRLFLLAFFCEQQQQQLCLLSLSWLLMPEDHRYQLSNIDYPMFPLSLHNHHPVCCY